MENVADRIEHTVLGPATTWAAVAETLDTALRHGIRACVPPCYVEQACEYAPTVDVTTVVGFPHGQHAAEVKCQEATHAWRDGAAQLDVVTNIGLETPRLEAELAEVVAAVPVPVTAVIESHLLEEWELRAACEAAEAAGAASLGTATGFAEGGATVDDVELMSGYLPVKANGGIDSWETAAELFAAGAERVGSPSGDVVVREYRKQS